MTPGKLIIGTRGSPLAMAQTRAVQTALQQAHPDLSIEIEIIQTTGDRNRDWSLSKVSKAGGTKGLFTKELEEAMLDGRVDCAVHSVKDLPSELPSGLTLAAFLPRAPASDLLVMREGGVAGLPDQAVVATSSVRRHRFLQHLHPSWEFPEIRGNVGTRLTKLMRNAAWHATILAEAGVVRLGMLTETGELEHEGVAWKTERLDQHGLLPAPGQGIVGIEARQESGVTELLASINDPLTATAATFERALLSVLECGCHSPVGVQTTIENGVLTADARVIWEEEPLPREARMAFPLDKINDWHLAVRAQAKPLFLSEPSAS